MIKYRPKLDSELWERKCERTFNSIEELKEYIADYWTKKHSFIGMPEIRFTQDDVKLTDRKDRSLHTGWRNFCHIRLDGKIVGCCGEIDYRM